MLLAKEDQIKALINHEACELVESVIPQNRLSGESYKEVFTIKLSDIVDYLVQNFSLEDLTNSQSSNKDGFYALPVPGGYETYEQEREFRANVSFLSSEREVWQQYAEYLVRTSGTGLDFTE